MSARRFRACLLGCWVGIALLTGAAVYAVCASLESVYRTSATVVTTLQSSDPQLARVLAVDPAWEGFLGQASTPTALLPASSPARAAIAARTARDLGTDPSEIAEAVTVRDSKDRRAFPRYAAPFRAITFEATASEPRRAARIADAYAREYAAYHRQLVDERVRAIGEELSIRIAAGASARSGALQRRQEHLRIAAGLEQGRFPITAWARVPAQATSPRPIRNGVVAGLVIALAGCLVWVVRSGRAR